MAFWNGPVAGLAWLGRHGPSTLAASLFLGLALPQLAGYVKPWLGALVFTMLLCSTLRADPAVLTRHLRSPRTVVGATIWIMAIMPLMFGALYLLLGLRDSAPGLYQIMILQAASAPITASAGIAGLLGLDVALSLLTLIAGSAVAPLSLAGFSLLFLGTSVISPLELAGKVFLFFASAGVVAVLIRRIVGQDRIARAREPIDGLNVFAAFVFAIAAMDGVPAHIVADPLYSLQILGIGTGICCVFVATTMAVFWRTGSDHRIVLGLLAGFRNLGVIMASVGTAMPDIAWFYFAMIQFPIYLMPLLLRPWARRSAKSR